jgi:uncharacterized membrane protein YfcA
LCFEEEIRESPFAAGWERWEVTGDVATVLLVVGVGFIAGFLNSVAGGGSLLTLPLLIFLGFPATVANGTNRVALLLQNVVAVSSYARGGVHHLRAGLLLAVPALVGAIVGSSLAVEVDDETLRRIIGIVLIVVGVYVFLNPDKWIKTSRRRGSSVFLGIVFFLVGVYGGFIQAGIGFFILTALVVWGGYDLVHANAVKVLIILIYTVPALIVFTLNGQVDYPTGLLLAVGNMSGAWVGTHLGLKKGAKWMRAVLLVAILFAALRLLIAP